MLRKFSDNQSDKYKQAVLVLRDLIQEEGEDIVTCVFAEATYDARQKIFEKNYGVQSAEDHHVCTYRLLGKACPGENCDSPQIIPCADHLSEWKKDGKTFVIVSQPYGLGYQGLKETLAFCEKYGLEASVNARPSWHKPGSVISLEYKRASTSEQLVDI